VKKRLGMSKHLLYEWKKRLSKPVSVPAEKHGADIRAPFKRAVPGRATPAISARDAANTVHFI
jgi:hypothetical protein